MLNNFKYKKYKTSLTISSDEICCYVYKLSIVKLIKYNNGI